MASLVDNAVQQRLSGFKKAPLDYTSDQYLLFLYEKTVLDHYHVTVFFQAAKGLVTCEVGVSRTPRLPYYRFFDQPTLGVSGFRARTRHLLDGLDAVTTKSYTNPDSLTSALLELAAEANSAYPRLLQLALPKISTQYAFWQPLYTDWLEAEKTPTTHLDQRYRGLVGEAITRRLLHDILLGGQFDSFLGHQMKLRYRDPKFLGCHVYLMAQALALIEPPEISEANHMLLDPGQPPERILFDPIATLTGRSEQGEAVELSPRMLERMPEWAFLCSFAALEAFLDNPITALSDVKATIDPPQPSPTTGPARTESSPPQTTSPTLSLDELYGGPSSDETTLDDLPPLIEELAVPSKPLRPDPFECLRPFLFETPEEPATPPVDPFDILGAQLGI